MKRTLLSFLLCFGCLLLAHCANKLAGTGGTASEVEGFAIKGTAIDGCGDPVPGAVVRIRPKGFLALSMKSPVGFDTVTDKWGRFYFDTVAADSYTVELNKNGRFGALEQFSIGNTDTFPIVLPEATLLPTGSIAGRINLPITDDTGRPYIALYSVDYMAKAMVTQDFRFDGVPQGVYNLRLVPSLKSKFIVELHDVEVTGDSVADLGTLTLFALDFYKGCASFECDSMAIRSILDANGRRDIAVASVVAFDSSTGRVVALNLSGRSIATLTKDIGSLSRLTTLDLRNNRIASIPDQIGYLGALESCFLDSNDLSELPPELGYCTSVKILTARANRIVAIDEGIFSLRILKLDVRDNRLEFLPEASRLLPAIRVLNLDNNELRSLPMQIDRRIFPEELTVGANRLCGMPEAIVEWLDGYDDDWRSSQKCE
jgi:hypothetical protein